MRKTNHLLTLILLLGTCNLLLAQSDSIDVQADLSSSPLMMFGGEAHEESENESSENVATRTAQERRNTETDNNLNDLEDQRDSLPQVVKQNPNTPPSNQQQLTLDHFRAALEDHPEAERFVIVANENGIFSIQPQAADPNTPGRNRNEDMQITNLLRSLISSGPADALLRNSAAISTSRNPSMNRDPLSAMRLHQILAGVINRGDDRSDADAAIRQNRVNQPVRSYGNFQKDRFFKIDEWNYDYDLINDTLKEREHFLNKLKEKEQRVNQAERHVNEVRSWLPFGFCRTPDQLHAEEQATAAKNLLDRAKHANRIRFSSLSEIQQKIERIQAMLEDLKKESTTEIEEISKKIKQKKTQARSTWNSAEYEGYSGTAKRLEKAVEALEKSIQATSSDQLFHEERLEASKLWREAAMKWKSSANFCNELATKASQGAHYDYYALDGATKSDQSSAKELELAAKALESSGTVANSRDISPEEQVEMSNLWWKTMVMHKKLSTLFAQSAQSHYSGNNRESTLESSSPHISSNCLRNAAELLETSMKIATSTPFFPKKLIEVITQYQCAADLYIEAAQAEGNYADKHKIYSRAESIKEAAERLSRAIQAEQSGNLR